MSTHTFRIIKSVASVYQTRLQIIILVKEIPQLVLLLDQHIVEHPNINSPITEPP